MPAHGRAPVLSDTGARRDIDGGSSILARLLTVGLRLEHRFVRGVLVRFVVLDRVRP